METEESYVNKLIPIFGRFFKIHLEAWSKCKNGRIDMILSLNDDIHFGVECKLPDKKRGETIGEYVKQAIRYTNYEFEVSNGVFKKIPIFICPAISYNYFLLNEETKLIDNKEWHKDRHEKHHSHHSINGFLGAFNVGEVRKSHSNAFYLSFSNKTIFSSQKRPVYENNVKTDCFIYDGLHVDNYTKLLKKLSI